MGSVLLDREGGRLYRDRKLTQGPLGAGGFQKSFEIDGTTCGIFQYDEQNLVRIAGARLHRFLTLKSDAKHSRDKFKLQKLD